MSAKEEWRPVFGYERHYEVSNLGQVRRLAPGMGATVGKVLNLRLNDRGYLIVDLTCNSRKETRYVHRLVAMTFLNMPPGKTEVNHKNGIKADCRASNLEWVTRQENVVHARDVLGIKMGGSARGEGHGRSKISADVVREIRRLYSTGNYSHAEIGRRFGLSSAYVGKVIRRENWSHIR